MKKIMPKTLIMILVFSFISLGQEVYGITPLALYYKCYGQITQAYPKRTDRRTQQVLSGTKSPIDACLEVLDKAKFTSSGNTRISDTSDKEALLVLKSMHKLHFSWFESKFFEDLSQKHKGNKEFMDAMMPALYYTRALFSPNIKFSSIVLEDKNLRAIRSDKDKDNSGKFIRKSPWSNQIKDMRADNNYKLFKFISEKSFTFAATGDLLGIRYMPADLKWNGPSAVSSRRRNSASYNPLPEFVDFNTHKGAGIIGSQPYLLLNTGVSDAYKTDGAINVPRRWANNFFQDIMCRPLPVVRTSDSFKDSVTGERLINEKASAPFRLGPSCAKCHVSMDRLSFTIRGYRTEGFGGEQWELLGGAFVYKWGEEHLSLRKEKGYSKNEKTMYRDEKRAGTLKEKEWPLVPDPIFRYRPERGTLYYRTWDGRLINNQVTGLPELGVRLASRDEPYLCLAKRYYKYFTGINVELGDIKDESHRALSNVEINHRNKVIKLGLDLKNDPKQNPRNLIEKILRSDVYKKAAESQRSLASEQ